MQSTKSADLIGPHQVSAMATTQWLQHDQILPLFAKGAACKTNNQSVRAFLLRVILSSRVIRNLSMDVLHNLSTAKSTLTTVHNMGMETLVAFKESFRFVTQHLCFSVIGVANPRMTG